MRRAPGDAFVVAVVVTALSTAACGQTALPRLSGITQSNGQRGRTCDLVVTGVHIGQGTGLVFEGDGVTVEAVTPEKTPPNPPANPTGKLTARLRIASDAPPGRRAFRVMTPQGPSDVGYLNVGQWPEVAEQEPNDTPGQAQRLTLPVTVVGRIDSEDVDCFRFSARKGQQIVCEALAGRIGSPLEPVLAIQDTRGHELARTEDFSRPDADIVFTAPQDGDFVLLLHDLRYQGGENHRYRLTVGEIPHVNAAFPPGGQSGAILDLRLDGVNLGGASTCRFTLPSAPLPDPLERALPLPTGLSNPVLLAVDPAETPVQAIAFDAMQRVATITVPEVIYGRLYVPRLPGAQPEDSYRFPATQGQRVSFDVAARRIGSRLDPVLTLLDAAGKELATAADSTGKDLHLEFTAPAPGIYTARITDVSRRQGLEYAYRLAVEIPQPDFQLAFTPDLLVVGRGGAAPLTVSATRLNGFDGAIALTVEGLPAGVQIMGTPAIGTGRNEVTLALTCTPDALLQATLLRVTGTAALRGKTIRRAAQGLLEEFVQNGDKIERTTRPVPLAMAAVALPPDITLTALPAAVALAPGKSAEITVRLTRNGGFTAKVPLTVTDLPPGVTASAAEVPEKQSEVRITLKAEGNASTGTTALLILGSISFDALHHRNYTSLPVSLTIAR